MRHKPSGTMKSEHLERQQNPLAAILGLGAKIQAQDFVKSHPGAPAELTEQKYFVFRHDLFQVPKVDFDEWFYRQCSLRRQTGPDQYEVMVSWIQDEKAKVGNTVRLRNSAEEEWSEGWLVVAAYERRPWSHLKERERDHVNQRRASDV